MKTLFERMCDIARQEPQDVTNQAKPVKRYWRDALDRLHCRHGVILYGTKCVQCEREG